MSTTKLTLPLATATFLLLTNLFAGCSSSDSTNDPLSTEPSNATGTIDALSATDVTDIPTVPEVSDTPTVSEVTDSTSVTDVADTPEILSEKEIDGIFFMREEEKLARDVYLKLFDQWGLKIFNNIAKSEQSHTDAVLSLINSYGLTDPATDIIGEFTDQELQKLYDDLMALGMSDSQNALWTGALIEETDIQDIVEWMHLTDNADIFMVYENLLCGSRNHLRAFVKQIEANGGTYSNQIPEVEQEVVDILTTSMEKCN